ncbi:MAG TPA: hypothetical protein GXZ48_02465 [Acholeplasmataceae bacterium]|nr:hypothetical protein [Acholeplasmataceae bacterium]
MNSFSKYFLDLFNQIWEDIQEWLLGLWNTLFSNVYENFKNYFDLIKYHSQNFDIFGWIMFVLSSAIMLGFIYFFFLRLVYYFRKYFKFQRTEVEKEELKEEIEVLNAKLIAAIDEKNKILSMKLSQLGSEGTEITPTTLLEEPERTRFTKLRAVDLQYNGQVLITHMRDEDRIALNEIAERFMNYCASQLNLYYPLKTIRLFLASMAASKVIILEGVSGTGKTSLPYALGRFFKNRAPIVSVQPSWRDRAELIGYFNEFTKKFNETDFLKAIYEANYRTDINIIVLDEMNLARIEYYFAEFLSILELPDKNDWKIDLVPDVWDNDPKLIIDGKISLPENCWFVGTANKDDSTFTITDKVYDRAMIIDFQSKGNPFNAKATEPMDLNISYLKNLFNKALDDYPIKEELIEKFYKIDNYMFDNFKIAFGNRTIKHMQLFIPVYQACGGTQEEALDYLFTNKVLRKFESLNTSFLTNEIELLIAEINNIFGEGVFSESIQYLQNIQRY